MLLFLFFLITYWRKNKKNDFHFSFDFSSWIKTNRGLLKVFIQCEKKREMRCSPIKRPTCACRCREQKKNSRLTTNMIKRRYITCWEFVMQQNHEDYLSSYMVLGIWLVKSDRVEPGLFHMGKWAWSVLIHGK